MKPYRATIFPIRTVLGIAAVMVALATPAASSESFPFHPGEKLTFELRWGFIPAGQATLEVHPQKEVDGKPAHHFVLTARTNSFLDVFYKVRQRIDAYSDLDLTHSLLYKEVHTVHQTKRDAVIEFDWENLKARYTDLGQAHPAISIAPGSFDPLSVFYFSRMFDPARYQHLERPVTDGKKCVVGRATLIGRETIQVEGHSYDTFLIEPELRDVGGVFEKSPGAKIQVWVTADDRRIPVRLKSKVIVGSFTGDLVSIETVSFSGEQLPDRIASGKKF